MLLCSAPLYQSNVPLSSKKTRKGKKKKLPPHVRPAREADAVERAVLVWLGMARMVGMGTGGTEGLLCACVGRSIALDMNGKAGRREPENGTGTNGNTSHSNTGHGNTGHGNANGNNTAMVMEAQPDTQQPHVRVSRGAPFC